MTNGEKWAAATGAKLTAYCRARGYRNSGLIRIGDAYSRVSVYEIDVIDTDARRATLRVDINAGKAVFVGDAGGEFGCVTADLFDNLLEPSGLKRRVPPSKRQLALPF